MNAHFNGSNENFYNINKWAPNTDIVFDEKIQIDPYADTEEERKNISDSLIRRSKK